MGVREGWWLVAALATAALVTVGCAPGNEPAAAVTTTAATTTTGAGGGGGGAEGCPPGTSADGDDCVAAGLPDDGCPPGTLASGDDCVAAGVPPEACPDGFVAEDGGCTPVVPSCESGEMATLGEMRCRPIMPCGEAPYGDVVTAADTQFVDAAYAGGDSDGSAEKPWTSIQAAVEAALPGATVAVAAGAYGGVSIDKPIVLAGRCPSLVAIEDASLQLVDGADGAVVSGIAVTGNTGWAAIGVRGVEATFESVWIHDVLGSRGFDITEPADAVVRNCLVERARVTAIMIWGSQALIEDTVVRDTDGRGLNHSYNDQTGTPSSGTYRRVIVDRSADLGAVFFAGDATIEQLVVRDVAPDDEGWGGEGISLIGWEAIPGTFSVAQSYVSGSHSAGLLVRGAEATVAHTTIVDTAAAPASGWGLAVLTLPNETAWGNLHVTQSLLASSAGAGAAFIDTPAALTGVWVRGATAVPLGGYGNGVLVYEVDAAPSFQPALTLTGSVIEEVLESGIWSYGAHVDVQSSAIRDVDPHPYSLTGGVGVRMSPSEETTPSLTVESSLVERCHEAGIVGWSALVQIRQSEARDIAPGGEAGIGNGISFYPDAVLQIPSDVTIDRVRVSDTHQLGISLWDSDGDISASVVDSVLPRGDGLVGDAISIAGTGNVVVDGVLMTNAVRAGLSCFGAAVELRDNEFRCNAIDLNGETWGGTPFALDDLGGNACGCGDSWTCKVQSSSLSPPSPSEDEELPTIEEPD